MNDDYSLKDKMVKLFLLGPWEFEGTIEFMDEKKIVLRDESGNLVLVLREKVVATMLFEKEDVQEKEREETTYEANSIPEHSLLRDENYGPIIPSDMLLDNEEKQGAQITFSMSMPAQSNFKPKGSEGDSTKKDGSDSKKNNQ
jgi:hypothetical protein